MSAAPAVVLFDLDGVLAHCAHAPRMALPAPHHRDLPSLRAALRGRGLLEDEDHAAPT